MILNLDTYQEIKGLMEDTFDAFLSDFFIESEAAIQALKTQNDLSELTRHAHDLKSTFATLGLEELSRLMARIEQFGRENNAIEMKRLINTVEPHYLKAKNTIRI